MRVRCRAVADSRSNALGILELESTPEGLWLGYESICSYRDGYAPGPPAMRSEHRVPWECVRASRSSAELLRLEVREPRSPFSHFLLRDFAHAEPQEWLARARAGGRLESPQVVLTQLCHELSLRLGSPIVRELPASGQSGPDRTPSLRELPRSGVALLIVTCSAVLAGLLLSRAPAQAPVLSPAPGRAPQPSGPSSAVPGQSMTAPPPPAQPTMAARAADALEQADFPILPAPALGGGCECIRHESLLWQQPPPRLSAFVTKIEHRPHGGHQHLELDLTIVNNGHRALRGLTMAVQISTTQPDPGDPEDEPVERSQYLAEPLPPGGQLSWHASARGDRFRLRIPDLGLLDEDGLDAAPAAAFAELAAGPPGLVRLHGATMLAFLGHADAREALSKARDGLSEAELAHVERALQSTGSLRVCQLVISAAGRATRAQSCLYNAADVAQSNFELKVRAVRLDGASETSPFAPARVLAEETLDWSGTLPPRRGRRLDLTLDLSRAGSSPEHRIELLARSRVRPQ